MQYRRCGISGLRLPAIALGLWHNFGDVDIFDNARAMARRAFELGITHFDLANNYGPPPGSAEINFGRILRADFAGHRDELTISTKAGYEMWPGPYGRGGSRKYLIASLDQSLQRLGLDYVDIFYHHCPDPDTSLEESMGALEHIVRSGRALYVGISSYGAELTRSAAGLLRASGTPCVVHQPKYNMFERWIEDELLSTLAAEGMGCVAFSTLAQGLLTDRYLHGIPTDSRAARPEGFLQTEQIHESVLSQVERLHAIAAERGQSLAQMALAWVLREAAVTSALIGASRVSQIEDCLGALDHMAFGDDELQAIEAVLQTAQ